MGDDDSFAVYMRVQDGMAPLPHMDPKYNAARRAGHQWFDDNGWDAAGRIEIPVSWGQQDIFKHINNVHYARMAESSRMRWLSTLAPDLGIERAEDIIHGTGTGIILKDTTIHFKAPVMYPDSLIWAAKPTAIDQKKNRFVLSHAAWSVKDNRVVVICEATIVIWDYVKNAKGVLTDDMAAVFARRGGGGRPQSKL